MQPQSFIKLIEQAMDNVQIIKVPLSGLEELLAISRETFLESFKDDNTEENMNAYLNAHLNKERLIQELTNPDSEFYFAMLDSKVIGYLKINFAGAQTELKDSNAIEIERIYVLKEYQRMKIGQVLYGKAVEIARQSGVNYIWLGVWEKNSKAISFYRKNGFTEFDKHIFMLGDDVQTDLMMKLVLT